MIQVIIIGSGNVAQHLISAFNSNDRVEVKQVFARKPETISHLIPSEKITANFSQIQNADLYIISITDFAIDEISAALPFENRLVVHTSGTASINAINDKNRKGVFYPLQTFSKDKKINF